MRVHITCVFHAYLLRSRFYEIDHFRCGGVRVRGDRAGSTLRLLWLVLPAAREAVIAPVEKGDRSRGVFARFPLGWIHELRTPDQPCCCPF